MSLTKEQEKEVETRVAAEIEKRIRFEDEMLENPTNKRAFKAMWRRLEPECFRSLESVRAMSNIGKYFCDAAMGDSACKELFNKPDLKARMEAFLEEAHEISLLIENTLFDENTALAEERAREAMRAAQSHAT